VQYLVEAMTDISLIDDAAWAIAKRRAEVIRPLAAKSRCPLPLVRVAAATLELSERQIFTLIKRCRDSEGALNSLLPRSSGGGKGRYRLEKDNSDRERIVS
jgi:putative transposase